MLVSKQKQILIPTSQAASTLQRQGVIFSEVSTPSGVKLVQLIIKQENNDGVPPFSKVQAYPDKSYSQPSDNICTICGETFSQKLAFNAHIKVHLKEKLKKRAKLKNKDEPMQTPTQHQETTKRKFESFDEFPLLSRVKVEVEPDISSCLTQSFITNPTPDIPDIQDNFVASEFSKEMEMNRLDLNNDITSILDEIEKDFEGPSIDLSNVHLDTPPDSDSETCDYWSSLLSRSPSSSSSSSSSPSSSSSSSPSKEGPGSSYIASTPNSSISGQSLDDRDEISFEKLMDVDELTTMKPSAVIGDGGLGAAASSARDHDYLVTSSSPSSVGHPLSTQASTVSTVGGQQLNIMKYANIPPSALALLNQVPGRILIERSATDSRILNIYGLGRVQGQPLVESRESEEREEDGDLDTEKGRLFRSKQSAECSVCGKMITTKNMARHMEKHTGKKKFQCDVCQAAFYQKTHLKNHVLLHDSSEYYECRECGQKFLRKTDYQKHLKTIHCIESPICCNLCGAQFNEIQQFELHKQMHTGERKELCGLCGEKFHSKSAMISHMQKHTSVALHKPFSCNVCHKTFSQKSHLNRHIKSHGGEQDLVCLVCNKQCKNKIELVRHRSSHVACSVCKSLFDTRVQLQQHMLKSHPVQPSLNCINPVSLDLDLFSDDPECRTTMSRSPVDILSTHLDSSPAPSSVCSSVDILDTHFNHFLADFNPEEPDHHVEDNHNLSLHDIADSSFFDINQHIEDDLMSTDFFAAVK